MGGGGAVTDTLQCLGAGAIAVAQFDGVSGIQRIQHHAGGGADRLIGGAGKDRFGVPAVIAGAGGAQRVDASAVTSGGIRDATGTGADALIAGTGNDFLPGGPGADVIDLTVGLAGADPLQHHSPSDGTADINDAGALSQAMPASIFGFGAGDKLALFRPGPGLGSGGIVAVPADGAWKIGDGAVFPLESGSARSDALNSNNHASLTAIECAINTDNGAGFGSSAGRMVALVISNRETQAAPTTGLHLRTDTDGDSVPEAGDVARRPAVLQGVTANQMASGASIELI